MKKLAAAAICAVLFTASQTASAGFLSGIGEAVRNVTGSAEETAPVEVDMENLTSRQQKVLTDLARGMVLVANSNMHLENALGRDTTETLATVNLVKESPTEEGIKNLTDQLKKTKYSSKDFDAVANGTEEQKQALKTAMEKASINRYASYICLALAAKDGASLVQDIKPAMKSFSLENMELLNQLKGIMSTAQFAQKMYTNTQKAYKDYDSKSNKARQLLNPEEAKSDSEQVKNLAASVMDGGLGI